MQTIRELWKESRGEIIGGLVLAGIFGLLSMITANADGLRDTVIEILSLELRLWVLLLLIAAAVGLMFLFRGYNHYRRFLISTTIDDKSAGNLRNNSSDDHASYYSCFISYSSEDQLFAKHLLADLQEVGIHCWFAPKDMKIGERIRDALDEAVLTQRKLLLILSKHSIYSHWIEQEVETAFERERNSNELVLFPVRLDNAVMNMEVGWAAHIRRTRHIGDFRNWEDPVQYQNSFQQLLRALKIN